MIGFRARSGPLSHDEAMRLACLALITLAACGAVPYSSEPHVRYDDNTEYHVEDRPDGFTLYVNYRKFQFVGSFRKISEEGRKQMLRIARVVAAERKAVRAFDELDLEEDMGRNFLCVTSWSCKAPFQYADQGALQSP